jgi:hypothetical protein
MQDVILSNSVSYSNATNSPELYKVQRFGALSMKFVFKNLPSKSQWALN